MRVLCRQVRDFCRVSAERAQSLGCCDIVYYMGMLKTRSLSVQSAIVCLFFVITVYLSLSLTRPSG